MIASRNLSADSSAGEDPILVVSGPTAGGKSDLSLRLASDLDAEIVNVDSVQIYLEADVGSAKLPAVERMVVPHHLIDVLSPRDKCDAGFFCQSASRVIAQIQQRGKIAILCGGTTLYITSLLHGLANLPETDPRTRLQFEGMTTPELYQRLKMLDRTTADRLHPNDRLRIARALEVTSLTGRPASQVLSEHAHSSGRYKALSIVLCPSRDSLYRRIDARAKGMLEAGLVAESRRLLDRYGPKIQLFRAIGYSQALRFMQGELDAGVLLSEIAMATRRYAKRQLTYWRNEPNKRGWIVNPAQTGTSQPPQSSTKGFDTLTLTYVELLSSVKARLAQPFENNEVWYISPPGADPH